MRNPRSPGRHAGWKRLGTYCNPLGVILVCAILWIGLIWPIRVENRIGKRKGRRGWIYPVVGFFAGLGGLGAWPSTTRGTGAGLQFGTGYRVSAGQRLSRLMLEL